MKLTYAGGYEINVCQDLVNTPSTTQSPQAVRRWAFGSRSSCEINVRLAFVKLTYVASSSYEFNVRFTMYTGAAKADAASVWAKYGGLDRCVSSCYFHCRWIADFLLHSRWPIGLSNDANGGWFLSYLTDDSKHHPDVFCRNFCGQNTGFTSVISNNAYPTTCSRQCL